MVGDSNKEFNISIKDEKPVKFSREWAMPNAWTFQIKPIKLLLERYVKDGKGWIEPFAGKSNLMETLSTL
jgi:hypothetical protein